MQVVSPVYTSVPPFFSTICIQKSEDNLSCWKLVLFHNASHTKMYLIINLLENPLKLLNFMFSIPSRTQALSENAQTTTATASPGVNYLQPLYTADRHYTSFPHHRLQPEDQYLVDLTNRNLTWQKVTTYFHQTTPANILSKKLAVLDLPTLHWPYKPFLCFIEEKSQGTNTRHCVDASHTFTTVLTPPSPSFKPHTSQVVPK
jgi:hypothetical protein